MTIREHIEEIKKARGALNKKGAWNDSQNSIRARALLDKAIDAALAATEPCTHTANEDRTVTSACGGGALMKYCHHCGREIRIAGVQIHE